MTERPPVIPGTGPEFQETIIAFFDKYLGNVTRNLHSLADQMTYQKWIRLTLVVCAYLLVRPYFVKIGNKVQEAELAKQTDAMTNEEKAAAAMRGDGLGSDKAEIPGVTEKDEEEDDVTTGADGNWGGKARKRQRKFIRDQLTKEELRRQWEEESDPDVADLCT
ncbi:hypothetical protein K402DRAFT_416648 [Aulographum hederae CBS 113979]|uniref:DUF1531-domain-containing protein n=1 Tax=Aulographum hederae CBS 113979 TaxID=1176131 RepID=A0A6G1HE79_9PEZI|nr:hypothetical protein K402DRAFT_416648 [Aulographum hederae CBS 113979]